VTSRDHVNDQVHGELSGDASPDEQFLRELRAARESRRRVPDFFIVGHAKTGTTALYEMLVEHPQIFMSRFKETQFLSRAPHERIERSREDSRRVPALRPQTLDAYLALFEAASAEQRAGEASTEYLRTPATARRIAALCPDARIVALFREPASFLRSLHLQLLEIGVEDESDFAKALALEDERRRGRRIPRGCRWPAALHYSEHVRYVTQLRGYHELFGRERVLSLIYDDFRADNEAVARQVLRFLDVDDATDLRASQANPTVRIRARRVHALAHGTAVGAGPMLRPARAALKLAMPAAARRRVLAAVDRMAVDKAPRAPDQALMRELRLRLRGEVVAAGEYLQRDLIELWGYDEL
jgi:hypothetical protein